jgi:hypothetical protein
MRRRPKVSRPRGTVGAVVASLARRRAAREPRVVLTERGGHLRALEPEDPAAAPLVEAAEALLSAVQRGSAGPGRP